MTNKFKKISLLFTSLTLAACGENFSVGGATIGGTGKPPIDPPDSHTTDQGHATDVYYYKLQKPAQAQCSKLDFKLEFLNSVTLEPVSNPIQINVAHQNVINNNNMHVRLSVTNLSKEIIQEEQPQCYIPIALHRGSDGLRYYPETHCSTKQIFEYAPNETKSFEVIVNALALVDKKPNIYTWTYGKESQFFDASKQKMNCPMLNLQFELIKNKASDNE